MEHLPEPRLNDDIDDILLECPRDSAGMYEVGGQYLERLAIWLDAKGMLQTAPGQEAVRAGVLAVQQLVAEDRLEPTLMAMEFVSEAYTKRLIRDITPTHIWLEKPLYADPEKILGAESFGSWLGRGYGGQGQVARRDSSGSRTSLEQITDYATRESQLPYLSAEGGLNLLYDSNGAFFFSSNAHRTAAAKLRHEPLGFRRLSVYKIDD